MSDDTAAGTAEVEARLAAGHAAADVLVEALPYIRRFRGATVVVKYGGNAMVDPALADRFAEDVVLLQAVGLRPVVVHGGGPQIGDLMARLGKASSRRPAGHRRRDARHRSHGAVREGQPRDRVRHQRAPIAVGLSGEDAGLIVADVRDPALGYVGDVREVNPAIVERLLAEELIPVISTIGSDESGQAYNINADTVAGAIAAALGAEKLVYLTDVAGLLRDIDDPSTLITRVSAAELRVLVDDEVISGGMIPKVDSCLDAIDRGVPAVHLLDGRIPHVLLLELFTDAGVGTMITRWSP
ncbi:MAG: acetylglutamate kinase [Acidimicrobiales bacterium]